jgi:hypothetical protein
MTLGELQMRFAEYATASRQRDQRLGLVLLASFVLCIAAIAGSLNMPDIPRRVWLAVMLTAVTAMGVEAVYVLVTTGRFHGARVPRCPVCGDSLAALKEPLTVLEHLASIERRPDLPARLRERVREAAVFRCPHCKARILAPAV